MQEVRKGSSIFSFSFSPHPLASLFQPGSLTLCYEITCSPLLSEGAEVQAPSAYTWVQSLTSPWLQKHTHLEFLLLFWSSDQKRLLDFSFCILSIINYCFKQKNFWSKNFVHIVLEVVHSFFTAGVYSIIFLNNLCLFMHIHFM